MSMQQTSQQASVEGQKPSPENARLYLEVAFEENNEVKALGARFDRDSKQWYIPDGVDPKPFDAWRLGNRAENPQAEFAAFLKKNGVESESAPIMDGKWHRASLQGDKKGEQNARYLGHADGRPNGFLQKFKGAEYLKWVSKGKALAPEQREALAERAAELATQREAERQATYERKAKQAYAIWKNEENEWASPDHPYLKAKGVKSHGVKQARDGSLIIAARDVEGRIQTIQRVIDGDKKRFLLDSKKMGAMHIAGKAEELGKGSPIIIAEGYSTAASLREATGLATVAAFDSSNLKPVAVALREKHPQAAIIIAADNDHALEKNDGIIKGKEASKAVGGVCQWPSFTDEEKAKGLTDFNDLHRSRGLEAVAVEIRKASAILNSRESAQSSELDLSVPVKEVPKVETKPVASQETKQEAKQEAKREAKPQKAYKRQRSRTKGVSR